MKRIVSLALILLLSGCGHSDRALNRAMVMRQKLQSSGCHFRCTVTADYGDVIHVFCMDCEADSQGSVSFRVVSPESISGITGSVDRDQGKLTFDDKALAFDLLADGQLSPVSAPWVMIHTLRGGYLSSCAESGDGMLLCIDDSYREDPLRLDIHMDHDGIPMSAEILWQGRRILSIEVESFEFE